VGRGIVGGGAGGGKPKLGMLRLGVVMACIWYRCASACCLSVSMLGTDCRGRAVGVRVWVLEARWPGTNEGVEGIARTGREEERKGAGSDRIWTEEGRRNGCGDGRADGGMVGLDVGEGWPAAEGDLAGAVTERLTLMPNGRGAGAVVGARDDCLRGTIMEPSACCVWGRTGRGRRNGLGVEDSLRWARASRAAPESNEAPGREE